MIGSDSKHFMERQAMWCKVRSDKRDNNVSGCSRDLLWQERNENRAVKKVQLSMVEGVDRCTIGKGICICSNLRPRWAWQV